MAGMDEIMKMLTDMKESAAKEREDNRIRMEAMQKEIAEQEQEAEKATKGPATMEALLHSGDTWVVPSEEA